MKYNCVNCDKYLNGDDVGATKKFINRGAEEFLCVPCLAKRFKINEQILRDKIEEFRRNGCSLF